MLRLREPGLLIVHAFLCFVPTCKTARREFARTQPSPSSTYQVDARSQFGILHAEGIAPVEIGFVDHLVFQELVELEIGECLEENPSSGLDAHPCLAHVMFERTQAVSAAMPVSEFARRNRIVGVDQ